MKQLLVDTIISDWKPQPLLEGKLTEGKYIVKGVIQRFDATNQNKRRYPKEILVPKVEKYVNEYIKQNRALGELDHPNSEIVNLSNVSHNILKLEWNGADLVGTIEVFDTPPGKILQELFKRGIRVGISSRGIGSVKEIDEAGTVEVQDDFELICWDFVSNPSTQGAFMKPLSEGIQVQQTDEDDKYLNVRELTNSIICDLPGGFCECRLKPKQ